MYFMYPSISAMGVASIRAEEGCVLNFNCNSVNSKCIKTASCDRNTTLAICAKFMCHFTPSLINTSEVNHYTSYNYYSLLPYLCIYFPN